MNEIIEQLVTMKVTEDWVDPYKPYNTELKERNVGLSADIIEKENSLNTIKASYEKDLSEKGITNENVSYLKEKCNGYVMEQSTLNDSSVILSNEIVSLSDEVGKMNLHTEEIETAIFNSNTEINSSIDNIRKESISLTKHLSNKSYLINDANEKIKSSITFRVNEIVNNKSLIEREKIKEYSDKLTPDDYKTNVDFESLEKCEREFIREHIIIAQLQHIEDVMNDTIAQLKSGFYLYYLLIFYIFTQNVAKKIILYIYILLK